MTVYFAYGSNMEHAAMRKRCGGARPLGPAPGMCVFGVLWKLTPRDLATLNSYENLDSGLYRRITLTVEVGAQRVRALVFMGRKRGSARPRPGYHERVVEAAQDWRLPTRYVAALRRLAPGYRGARPAETGELA
jgi:AIG2-like family